MKASILKVSPILCAAVLLSACSSTSGSSSREVERITDHYELMPVTQYDYEWDDNKSFAMNAMLSMGVQGNVYEARNVEDTYTHYSGAQRAGSAVIDFLGVNLGSAIADVANTGRANREAASVPPATGFFVPQSLIVDDAQQSFLNVRDYIYEQVISALKADFRDIQDFGVYTRSLESKTPEAVIFFDDNFACPRLRSVYNQVNHYNPSGFALEYAGPDSVNWCPILIEFHEVLMPAEELEREGSLIVKVQFRRITPLMNSIYRHADVIAFLPHRHRESSRTWTSAFPYIAFKGEAHLFTRDNATVPINKPKL